MLDIKPHNFIVVTFGDSDFGNVIRNALIDGVDLWYLDKKACPIVWKQFIIAHLTGHQLKKNAVHGSPTLDFVQYLNQNYFQSIRVTFEYRFPDIDGDGGHAAYDLNLRTAWTF